MSSDPRKLVLFLLLLLVASAVHATTTPAPRKVAWIKGIYVAESPTPQPIPSPLLWAQAESRAKALRGTTLRGSGNSMLPLYQPGTVLVIAPVPFDELKRGQTVVYFKERNQPVAHILIAKCKDGWRVTGLNNQGHDAIGVTAENLFGVVAEAYQPIATTSVVMR